MVQEALDRWWGPLMQMHGPRTDPAKDRDLYWRIKAKTGEQLRQEFLIDLRAASCGRSACSRPTRSCKPRRGERRMALHRARLAASCALSSPATARSRQERLDFRRLDHDQTAWVRDAILAPAEVAA